MWTPCDDPIDEYNEKTEKWKHIINVHMQIPMQVMKTKCVGTVVDLA